MKKILFLLTLVALLTTGCANEFNRVYKTTDYSYKYDYAKECFARGKYTQAVTLLTDLVVVQKGTDNAEECLYMLAMAEYCNKNYQTASEVFKKYFQTYPRGQYAEMALYYVGQSLYMGTPEPRLDQSPTNGSITAYQQFMDLFPDSPLRPKAQERLYELTDKLIQKEFLSAQLYYNLGNYFGNINSNEESNYTASIITAQNTLKNYPYCSLREDFMLLIMKSKFQLAENSTEEKRIDRYRDAEDECYGFINEFPDSKNVSLAEKYIAKCKKVIKD